VLDFPAGPVGPLASTGTAHSPSTRVTASNTTRTFFIYNHLLSFWISRPSTLGIGNLLNQLDSQYFLASIDSFTLLVDNKMWKAIEDWPHDSQFTALAFRGVAFAEATPLFTYILGYVVTTIITIPN